MKIFRLFKSLLFLCLTLVVTSLSAQEVIGTWKGSLSVQGTELPIVVRIWQEDGTYKALMDSPQQNAIGIKVESVKYENKMLSISVPSLAVTIAGTISGTTYSANFTQGNIELPLVMDRTSTSATICRKQEPLPPYPYHTEEVKFPSVDSGVELNGTLTLPKESGKYPAVVLVSGSGTQNRDEELLGHKPFKVIADYLTRQGIIVLRYDDREFASKKYEGATSRNYANDALGAVEFLKSIDKVDSKRIGIIGHSEGGTIAFMCAAQNKEIDFIVSLAGMAVAGDKCLLEQNRRAIAITGLSEEIQNKCIEVTQAIFDETQKREVGDLRQSAKKIVDELIAKHSAQNLPPALIQNFEKTLSTI
ncbi:MAG: acetylxylan esterase, partial [Alistipes sp.]|nr:acetylxylan esterase [Alistipes sp.]